jgi:ribosomal protein S18 acetylase RimI-like enzyme
MGAELVQLRSFYAPPGFLLLARVGHEAAGCVGLRTIDAAVGEVRRLYVRPSHRSSGIARRLMDRLLEEAAAARLRRLVLSTLPTMTQALALYAGYGFVRTEPYVERPTEGVVYLALDL